MQQQQFDLDCFNPNDEIERKKKTRALLRVVQAANEDREWYPTCEIQIQAIKADLKKMLIDAEHYGDTVKLSVCDVGAGDGRLLMALTEGERYAIEKSTVLIQAMDKSIAVIGTDFHQQTLVDKKVDLVTCNPPYSEYSLWAQKIITEANCALVYLILPSRWVNEQKIADALAVRKAEYTIIGSFDYESADRIARAKVDIVRVELGSLGHRYNQSYCNVDPFDLFFAESFPLDAPESEISKWTKRQEEDEALQKEIDASFAAGGELVKREGLVRILSDIYQRDLQKLMETYQAMSNIPGDLMLELEVNIENVKKGLKLKIKSLKDRFWQRLFDALDCITDKLTSNSRKKFLETITERSNVDFNESNALAIVIWSLKHANIYYEKQIVEVYQQLTEAANVIKYKSNEKVIKNDRWRYCRGDIELLGPYALDYRIVLQSVGGIETGYSYSRCGLSQRAIDLVGDLVTLSYNLGFDSVGNVPAVSRMWIAGKPQVYYFQCSKTGKKEVLFEAKAFLNGNIHIRMSPKFIQKLNVVHGRLKGWLRSAADAVNEMDVTADIAEESFKVPLAISVKDVPMLLQLGVK